MSRHFNDFISAYFNYARDNYLPDQYHLWTGYSILAAALERKVWFQHNIRRTTFPNMFVMLVGDPGIGKSSAIDVGMDILRQVKGSEGDINLLPDQVTEAAFYVAAQRGKSFNHSGLIYTHMSSYLSISEGSNSLKEITGGGNILSALTAFYDCQKVWVKKTVGRGDESFENICMNLLVGCTFVHLRDMIPQKHMMGGFASRNIYVVHKGLLIRKSKLISEDNRDEATERKLVADLTRIHSLKGGFRAEPAFEKDYEAWIPANDLYVQQIKSPRAQALLARTGINTLKLSMLISASESDDMILRKEHWEKAVSLIGEVNLKLDHVLTASQDKNEQGSITSMILQYVKHKGPQSFSSIRSHMLQQGVEISRTEKTLHELANGGGLKQVLGTGKTCYELNCDPNDYL